MAATPQSHVASYFWLTSVHFVHETWRDGADLSSSRRNFCVEFDRHNSVWEIVAAEKESHVPMQGPNRKGDPFLEANSFPIAHPLGMLFVRAMLKDLESYSSGRVERF